MSSDAGDGEGAWIGGECAEVGCGAVRWVLCDRLKKVEEFRSFAPHLAFVYFGRFFLALERYLLIFSFRVTGSASVRMLSNLF